MKQNNFMLPKATGAGTAAPHNKGAMPEMPTAGTAQLSTFPSVKCCDMNVLGFSLQLFAEGGAAGAAGAGDGGAVGSAAAAASGSEAASAEASNAAKQTQAGEGLSRAAKRQAKASGEKFTEKNPLATVQYGKAATTPQDAAAGAASTAGNIAKAANSAESKQPASGQATDAADKNAAFEALIRGEYKDQFSARAQNIINQRFKETKQLEAKSRSADALMQRLAQRYGVNASDTAAILKAAEADDSYTEKVANERGLSVDEMRRVKQLESENAQLRSTAQQRSAKDAAQKLYQTWVSDGEKLKTVYPEFDFKTELKNAEFSKLIKSGVPLRKAYETSHLEQILGGAMQYTADQVAKGMAARIADRSARPAENGTTPHAGAVVKPDVASLSRADREEIERRVMRGEKILF